MRILTYLFSVKITAMRGDLISEGVYSYLHEVEGRWCRPFTDKLVGTVLFLVNKENAYCRSLMKPLKIRSKKILVEVNEKDSLLVQVRLYLDGQDKKEDIEYHACSLATEAGMRVKRIKYNRCSFGDVTYNDKISGMIVDVTCADFIFDVEVQDIEKFKKAYIQGLGSHREHGCGMIVIR